MKWVNISQRRLNVTISSSPSLFFVLCPKFSDFVPRASSALWIFPTAHALDFLQPLDTPEKRFEFHINEQEDLNKLLKALLIYSLIGLPSRAFFHSSNTGFLHWMWICDYYDWNRLERLKTGLLTLVKNKRNTSWFRLFHFRH